MNTASALIDPSILFFLLGIGAGLVRSNLLIPNQMARFLALYLLMSIGLKGGFALSKSGLEPAILVDLALAISLATLIPMITYAYLKRRVSAFNAAAIAATYGSVSAVTFITAMQYLDNRGIQYGGHMSAALALMESPAILFAIVMANLIAYGLCAPMVHAGIALFLCIQLGVSLGNASLLAVLAASASYIAVPAVLRHAIPEASPIYYLGLPLGLTFPFNILFGIPLYVHFAEKWIHRLM